MLLWNCLCLNKVRTDQKIRASASRTHVTRVPYKHVFEILQVYVCMDVVPLISYELEVRFKKKKGFRYRNDVQSDEKQAFWIGGFRLHGHVGVNLSSNTELTLWN